MLVANSFDLWQKDTFFPAAEEVQQSADTMESAYRTWLKARKESLKPQHLDEQSRQLQMALGTTKWQLEEFERAVNMSDRNSDDELTVTRHKQFISAIRDQISRVESDLKESCDTEGKNPFRWVNLDEEECDDLAHFLSGTSQTGKEEETHIRAGSTSSPSKGNRVSEHEHGRCVSQTRDECMINDDMDRDRITYCALKKSVLEIIIDRDHMQERNETTVDATAIPKEKGPKPLFWRSRAKYHPRTKAVLRRIQSWIDHHLTRSQRSHRQQPQQVSSPSFPVPSMSSILLLSLTLFLVVPFVAYVA